MSWWEKYESAFVDDGDPSRLLADRGYYDTLGSDEETAHSWYPEKPRMPAWLRDEAALEFGPNESLHERDEMLKDAR